ncbi:hypothetical protein CRYUN_Cryun04dG0190700 [Craigia yunnanensis]
MERLVKSNAPPMKASELWRDKLAVLLCIQRPGMKLIGFSVYVCCNMITDASCAEMKLASYMPKKPIFDALGVQIFAVLHEHIESEVPALGGGKLLKDKFLSGFVFNPRAILVGEELELLTNLSERNFGDWAPVSEVIEICARLQNQQQDQRASSKSPQEYE